MKLDTAWLFLFIILIFSVGYLFFNWYKKYKRLLGWINYPADHILRYNNLAEMIQVIADSRISKK